MKKLTAVVCGFAVALPLVASAQSSGDLQTQAQALLAQVQALQAQLASQGGGPAVGTTNGAAVTTGTVVNSSACPNVGRVLKPGLSGDDVTRLQQFLARDPSIYPEANISGYYGALTQAAVQRWQTKYNIVSSGSAATTGYGIVGPRTAAAIALLCSTSSGNNTSAVGGFIQVSPISGNAPLIVNVVATVNTTNSCAGAIYTLSWGDNTNPVQIPVSANNCTQIAQTYQHTYGNGGTYVVTLSAGSHQTTATVTVYGNGSTGAVGTGGMPAETFNASVASGAAPLAVTFTGVVNSYDKGWCATGCSDTLVFGDGTTGTVPVPAAQGAYQNYSISHTYQSAGTYTAILYQGGAGAGRPIVGSANVAVNGSGTASSGTYQPPTVTPLYGGNPRAVSIGFDMTVCASYSIDWGDGTPVISPSGSCINSNTTVQHTYANTGNFTITLTRGSQVNTAAINITN